MKTQFRASDAELVSEFLEKWVDERKTKATQLLSLDECEPIYFDTDEPEELNNCFVELNRVGFTESVKRIFQGDHFYRSDTGKCPRCYRHRPEIHWNNENLDFDAVLCDRCLYATSTEAV